MSFKNQHKISKYPTLLTQKISSAAHDLNIVLYFLCGTNIFKIILVKLGRQCRMLFTWFFVLHMRSHEASEALSMIESLYWAICKKLQEN